MSKHEPMPIQKALREFIKARDGVTESKAREIQLKEWTSGIDPTDSEAVGRCVVQFTELSLLPNHIKKGEAMLEPLALALEAEIERTVRALRAQKQREDEQLLSEAEAVFAIFYPPVKHVLNGEELHPARDIALLSPVLRSALPGWNELDQYHISLADRSNGAEQFDKAIIDRAETILRVESALAKQGGKFRTLPPLKKWLKEQL